MINEEEKFDDLLRTKLSEREFFFDELNWDGAEKLIKRSERIRQIKRLSVVLASGIAIGVAVTVPVMNMLNKDKNNTVVSASATKNSTTPAEPNLQSATPANNADKSERTNSNPNETIGTSVVPASAANNASTGNQNSPVANTIAANSPKSASATPAENSKTINHSVTHAVAANASHSSDRDNSSVSYNPTEATTPSASKNINSSNKPLASANRNTNHTKGIQKGQSNNSASNNKIASANTSAQNAGSAQLNNGSNKGLSNEIAGATNNNANSTDNNSSAVNTPSNKEVTNNIGAKTTQTANNSSADKTTNSNNASSTPASQTSGANASTKDNTTAQTTASATKNVTQNSAKKTTDTANAKSESGSVASAESLPPLPRKTARGTVQLSIDAGGNYAFGWNNNGTTEGNGISPIGGITGTYFLTSKFSLSLGAQFNELTNLKTSYSHYTTTYGFGSSTTDTIITPHTIYYIGVPLTLHYNINDKNAIGIGASMLFLMNVSSTFSSTTQTDLGPTTKSQTVIGYTSGFNTSDIQLRVGYRRKIWKGFWGTIEFYRDLSDIETAPYFTNSTAKNMGLRLLLSYNLIDR